MWTYAAVKHLIKAVGIKDAIGPLQQRLRVGLGDAFAHLVTERAEAAFDLAQKHVCSPLLHALLNVTIDEGLHDGVSGFGRLLEQLPYVVFFDALGLDQRCNHRETTRSAIAVGSAVRTVPARRPPMAETMIDADTLRALDIVAQQEFQDSGLGRAGIDRCFRVV